MGFSRNIDYSDTRLIGPLFYANLFTNGHIASNVFGLYLADDPT